VGRAPARNKIQLAFSALESSLSLKHSTPHKLVFKTLESDRKAILPAIKDRQPKHVLLAAALMANATWLPFPIVVRGFRVATPPIRCCTASN
jgi:hypothetical protein